MTDENIFICSFMSSAPYFIGCEKGYMMLLPSKIKCDRPCSAWVNGRCIRLNEGNDCSCNGGSNANSTN